jgi:hypothetical protein
MMILIMVTTCGSKYNNIVKELEYIMTNKYKPYANLLIPQKSN